jgi:hypothetical protein
MKTQDTSLIRVIIPSLTLALLLASAGCSPEFNAKRTRVLSSLTGNPSRDLRVGEGFHQTQGGGAFGQSSSFKISGLNVGGSIAQSPNTSSPAFKFNGGGVNGQLPAINYQPGQ